jgi:hypothetical protein
MNSHNPRAGFAFHKTPARSEQDQRDTKQVSASLQSGELSISDSDDWCDPYNSTGKHVVLKARLSPPKD